MSVSIELQNVIESEHLPTAEDFQNWASKALKLSGSELTQTEITIRVVSNEESQSLNSDYRQKDKPTNILSFPFEIPEMVPSDEFDDYLGDLVICEKVLIEEASRQNKTVENHWAHLIVHGVLHLLGFDHIEEQAAQEMESIEVKVLAELNIPNPYIE